MRAALIANQKAVALGEVTCADRFFMRANKAAVSRIRFTRAYTFGYHARLCVFSKMYHLCACVSLLMTIGNRDGIKLALGVIAAQNTAWVFPCHG